MKDVSLVGMTITAALTNFMSLTTYRGMQTKTIVLNDGKLTEYPIKKLPKQQHGLVVELIPSQKYLGEFHITSDMVQDYLRSMSYVVDPKITITLVLEDEPKKSQTTIYKAQGLSAAVKYMSSTLEVPPIEVSCVTDDFDISLAFSYDRSFDSTAFTSFCNYVITTEAGTHEQAAQRAICEFFTREAKKQDPNSRLEITYDDCKNGLLIAVNLEHINPEFEGQHKSKVSNKEVLSEGKKELLAAIYKIMNNNPGPTKKILNYLRNVAKARQESHKIKGISVKKQTTFLEDAEIPKFFPVTDRNGSGYRELYLAEGD